MMDQTATTPQTQTVRSTKTVYLLPPASDPPESVWSILDAMWLGVVIPHKRDEELLRHYAKKLDAALKQMEESHRREIDRLVLNKDFTDTMKFCHQAILTRNGPRKRMSTMTLDEAIEHAESKADDTPCGLDHAALAEWLRELRQYQNCDYGIIMAALRHVELFLRNIEKHAQPILNPGDECVACKGVGEQLAELNRALCPECGEPPSPHFLAHTGGQVEILEGGAK